MSLEIYVFLNRSQIPSVAAWQKEVDELGFGVALDKNFSPAAHSGFVPCSLDGSPTGFEFSLGTKSDMVRSYPHLEGATTGIDTSAVFTWGGGLTECASAVCSAAALARLSGGMMYDPQEDKHYSASEAAVQGHDLVNEIRGRK